MREAPTKIIVSSYLRPQQTAEPFRDRFPDTDFVEWSVHEFTFLPTEDYLGTTVDDRRHAVGEYWQRVRPHRVLGPGAQFFSQFIRRVESVRDRLFEESQGPFALISHRKFLAALIWMLVTGGSTISSRHMTWYHGF